MATKTPDSHSKQPLCSAEATNQGLYWAESPQYAAIITPSRLLPGRIDPHDDPHAHAVIHRYALGCPDDLTTAVPRENVLHFFYPHALEVNDRRKECDLTERQMRRDLFLLAFAAMQSLPSSDKWSFYQIAGIHGLPHVPYDDVKGSWDPKCGLGWWGGYCQHGSPLFPTWHRPYLMLLEQSIIRQAKLLGESLSDTKEAHDVAGMADKLRLPFWDWADHSTRVLGLLDIFTITEITLAYPWKSFSCRSIPNPLKSFVLPENVGTRASSDAFNPTAKPNYQVPPQGVPFIPLGYPTVRHVSPAYTTKNDKVNLAVLHNAETTLVEGVHAIFHHVDWLSFSNHSWSPNPCKTKTAEQYCHYPSIEAVHDIVHDTIGGAGGQMSYPETAGFDPIFFFHHCNVDRLIALWQYCYPTSWIPSDTSLQHAAEGTFTIKPDSTVDASTDLTPFRRFCDTDQAESFVSSDDIRTVDHDCGYSYPEIIEARKEKWPPARMLHYMLRLYKPLGHSIHRWFLVVEGIVKGAFNGPYSIRVFLDLPNGCIGTTPITSPHFAGCISVFARSQTRNSAVRCANCEQHPLMRSSVELTRTMLRLGITTAPPKMTGRPVQRPSNNPLRGEGAVKLVYVNPKGDHLPDLPRHQLPKLTIVYQEAVPEGVINEFLLTTASRSNHLPNMRDVLRQNHALPKGFVHLFPIDINT